MITSPVPTRAEVSDVANAVLDGTSAVMLSGETAIGADPARAVSTMASIVERAEREFDYVNWGAGLGVQEVSADAPLRRITAAITGAAWRAALEEDVAAIIACTQTGATARAISRFRPSMPIVAVTPHERTLRQLSMSWGVETLLSGACGQHRRWHLACGAPGGRGRVRVPGRRRRGHRRVALRERARRRHAAPGADSLTSRAPVCARSRSASSGRVESRAGDEGESSHDKRCCSSACPSSRTGSGVSATRARAERFGDVYDPATGELTKKVAFASPSRCRQGGRGGIGGLLHLARAARSPNAPRSSSPSASSRPHAPENWPRSSPPSTARCSTTPSAR